MCYHKASLLSLSKASLSAKANAFFKEKENDGLSGYRVWEEGNKANNPFPLPPLPPESIATQYKSCSVTISVILTIITITLEQTTLNWRDSKQFW